MVYVRSVNFIVLVNGYPTYFFRGEWGLRQGCPLSPLRFLLVIEGLSLLIKITKHEGRLSSLKIATYAIISHLLFVDDVLLIGKGTMEEWVVLKDILDLFCRASCMEISSKKSNFHYNLINQSKLDTFKSMFGFVTTSLDEGFKYLGFTLKPNKYQFQDWLWLIKKIEKHIKNWAF